MRAVLLHLVFLTALPAAMSAQARVSLDVRGGLAVPAGELATVGNPGMTVGAGAAVRLRGPLHVRVDLEASFLGEGASDSGEQFPGMNFLHRTVGLEYALGRVGRDGPLVSANVGGGVSTFEIEGYVARVGPDAGRTYTASESDPVLTSGLTAEIAPTRHLAFFARAQVYAVMTDEDYTSQFQRIAVDVEPFRRAWSVPISGGVRLRW
ncbi:MAG TPA: hypothetical protein VFO55_08970 [Gemmatimonadaceae bacterium]|nr:hypothetical protein [Gemmatimonadaceae bacterium]